MTHVAEHRAELVVSIGAAEADPLHTHVDTHCLSLRLRDGSDCAQGATPSTGTAPPSFRAISLARSPSTTRRQRAGCSSRTTNTWRTPRAAAAWAIVLTGLREAATWPHASTPARSRAATASLDYPLCSSISLPG